MIKSGCSTTIHRKETVETLNHTSKSTVKSNIHISKLMMSIQWDQLSIVHYELFQVKLSQRLTTQHTLEPSIKTAEIRGKVWQCLVTCCYCHKLYLYTLRWKTLLHLPYLHITPNPITNCIEFYHHVFNQCYLIWLMTYDLIEQHFHPYEAAKNWAHPWIASKCEQNSYATRKLLEKEIWKE